MIKPTVTLKQTIFPHVKQWLSIALSVVVFAIVFAGLSDMVDYRPRVTLAITLAAIVLWILEPIPFSMTAIIVLFALPVSGAVTMEEAMSGFASPAAFLVVAGFMIAKGVEQTPLGKRLAYQLLYWFGERKGGVLFGVILIPQIMAFFIPATAVRTAMILPVVFSVFSILELKKGDLQGKQLMMGLAAGASVSGTAVLPAAIGNVVAVDLLNYYLQENITYFQWFILAIPMWLLMIPVCWLVIYYAFPGEKNAPKHLKPQMKKMIDELGPLTAPEKRLLFILFTVFILWTMEGWTGWSPVIPALIGACLIAWPGMKVADWEKLISIQFGPFILVAVTLSLGRALYSSGAIQFMGKWLENDFTLYLFSTPTLAVLTVTVLTQLIHKVTSNVSTAVVATIPIVMALASHAENASVLLLGFVAGMTCLFGFIIVVETIPNVMVHDTGWVTQQDFLKSGIWLTLISILFTYMMAFTWWAWLGYL